MARDSVREGMVVAAATAGGWGSSPYEGTVMGPLVEAFGVDPCHEGKNRKGRGAPLFDLYSETPLGGGVSEYRMVSVKTHSIGPDGKRPAYCDLTEGGREHVLAVIRAAHRGLPIPVLHFVSGGGKDSPSPEGEFIIFDAGPAIRACIPLHPDPPVRGEKYAKGTAPCAYLTRTSPKPSGGVYVRHEAGTTPDRGFTLWETETTVSYTAIRISYHACREAGLVGEEWAPVHVSEVPAILAALPWGGEEGLSVIW